MASGVTNGCQSRVAHCVRARRGVWKQRASGEGNESGGVWVGTGVNGCDWVGVNEQSGGVFKGRTGRCAEHERVFHIGSEA